MISFSHIPKDWSLKFIPEVVFFQEGPGVRKHQYREQGVKLLNVGNINDNRLDLSTTDRYISKEEAYGRYKHFLVNEGDLLIASSGIAVSNFHTKIAFVGKEHLPLCMNTSTIRFRVLDSSQLDIDYFKYFLMTPLFKQQLGRLITGTAQLNFGPSHLKQMKISFPSLPEQRHIAAILDKADAIRRKRQQAIALTEELLRSAFLEMFGDPVTNPKGWSIKAFDEVGVVQGGLQLHSRRASNPIEVPYLRVANVYRDRLELGEIKRIRVTEPELKRVLLREGDLLIVEGHGNREEIGRSAVWDGSIEPCLHQNHLIRVRTNKKIAEPKFVSAYLNSPGGRRQLFRFGKTTSGLNTISSANVKATQILLPPLDLQKHYLAIIERVEQIRNRLQEITKQQNNLFNTLVQRAFRGEL